jgi:hypothetical protein
MSKVSTIILIFILTSAQTGLANNMETLMDKTGLDIQFKDCQRYKVKPEEMRLITDIIEGSEEKVRALLPALPQNINVTVTFVEEDFNYWGTSMGLMGVLMHRE